mgnify:CR=1 FL=1
MTTLKILVTGAVGSGKTTLIRHLAAGEVVTTEAESTEVTDKPTTTVALDYGQLNVADYAVHLYGTPGQARFEYMWETLSSGIDGMIVLVHAGHEDAERATRHVLQTIRAAQGDIPFVVGVTHTDLPDTTPLDTFQNMFSDTARATLPADVRDLEDGRTLLTRLLLHLS